MIANATQITIQRLRGDIRIARAKVNVLAMEIRKKEERITELEREDQAGAGAVQANVSYHGGRSL